jgi:hypothetical protein
VDMWINYVNKYKLRLLTVDNLWKMGITLLTVLTKVVNSRKLSTFH